MLKAKVYDFKDSNCADIGSAMDKAAREAAGATEPAWANAGKEPGVQVWRMEKFTVQDWPKESYGNFFDGDAYIVLHTYTKDDSLRWNVHFWLGADCSQDEAGTAAYKTVELDDTLGGAPVQYRQVMGFESPNFLALFPPAPKVLSGGIASGFRHVQEAGQEYKPRLLRIVQEKAPRASGKGSAVVMKVTEVPMHNGALNQGDVYILDKGKTLLQWQGAECSPFEKNKAAEIVRSLDDGRGSNCDVTVFEGAEANEEFHSQLEGTAADVKSKEEAEAESAFLKSAADGPKLFKYGDEFEEIDLNSALDTTAVYVLDAGFEVFVWVGAGADKDKKPTYVVKTQENLLARGRSAYLPVVCVSEGTDGAGMDDFVQAKQG